MATRNRYAEIMAQYAQSQPFSFFGYPESYTGGYDATAYTPAAAPATRYEEIMAQPAMGGGGRGMQEASEPRYNPLSPLATPESGSIGFQILDAYGRTKVLPYALPAGLISQSMLPSQLEQAGINAAKAFADAQAGYAAGTMFGAPPSDARTFAGGGYGPIGTQTTPTGAGIAANPMGFDPAQARAAQDAQDARVAAFDASRESTRSGGGGGMGGDGGGASNSNPGDPGRGGGGAHLAKGGYVSMQHLGGPDPEGPDDGYAALKDGEFVINDKAVKKYGIELMNAINSGKISKGKLRGLLEM
jgi:hypothetical protein